MNATTTTQAIATTAAINGAICQQMPSDRGAAVEMFLEQQARDLVRPATITAYRNYINYFFNWVDATGRNLNACTIADAEAYKSDLMEQGKARTSINCYLTALRRFYTFLSARWGYINIMAGVRTPRVRRDFEKERLPYSKIQSFVDYYQGSARDYAIVNLMILTGLRCVEVARLTVGDIATKINDRGERVNVLKVWGKGRDVEDKEKDFVVLCEDAATPLYNYLATRGNLDKDAPMFANLDTLHPGTNGGALTTRSVSRIVRRGLDAVGLTTAEFTAHSLRHTTGCLILHNGGTLQDVQSVLRHRDGETSKIYVKMEMERERLNNPAERLVKWN